MKKTLNNRFAVSLQWLSIVLFLTLTAEVRAQSPSESQLQSTTTANAWLEKMARATRGLNYQMSFVLLKPGTDSQPYLWRHGVTDEGVEMEQLNLLNGPGMEILRIGNQVSYFEPNVPPYSLQSEVINGPLPVEFIHSPERLAQGYEFIIVGRSRISGRLAQQIRVVSKDRSRFSFNLWLDQDTGLLLKMNMVDLQGKTLEQIQVTALEVSEHIHPYFERIEVSKLPPVIAVTSNSPANDPWQVELLPQGMQLIKRDIHRLPVTGNQVDYMMLSDGLIDVSIYLQQVSGQSTAEDVLLRHESNTFLTRRKGSMLITVIGKLPAQTANAIAESISFRPQ